MKKIIVTTYPFDEDNPLFDDLRKMGYRIIFNLYKRKMTPSEIGMLMEIENPDIIVAGTEKYDKDLLDVCTNLKMISRVGIGMDSIDQSETEKRGIYVSNTPDGPTNAVAEYTIGQMINCLRGIERVGYSLKHKNGWERYIGKSIKGSNVGIIGYGRIGRSVAEKIRSFNPNKIYIHDPYIGDSDIENDLVISTKKDILKKCDIISLHVPGGEENRNYISQDDFSIMKKDSILVNASRGGVVNEDDLYVWLSHNPECSAAMDVFDKEPYDGNLKSLDNISLTSHIGSYTKGARIEMENQSIKNVIEYLIK